MKGLTRANNAAAFIAQATSGEMKKGKLSTNSNLTKVRFTNIQMRLIDKMLKISNIGSVAALFGTVAEFMRSDFNHLDYVDYLNFIVGAGNGTGKGYSIQKNRAYELFCELYEDYRVNWVNIRVRGVIILSILHYAKNKLNLDLNELLEGIVAEDDD